MSTSNLPHVLCHLIAIDAISYNESRMFVVLLEATSDSRQHTTIQSNAGGPLYATKTEARRHTNL